MTRPINVFALTLAIFSAVKQLFLDFYTVMSLHAESKVDSAMQESLFPPRRYRL